MQATLPHPVLSATVFNELSVIFILNIYTNRKGQMIPKKISKYYSVKLIVELSSLGLHYLVTV